MTLPGSAEPSLHRDLLNTHHTQTRTVSLPLAGDVNIWVIQPVPFPPGEDLLTIIEDTVRASEGLLAVPFPTTDVILLIFGGRDYLVRGEFLWDYMRIDRDPRGEVDNIPHETAHYYFNRGPQWLVEGAAQFIQAYVNDRSGLKTLNGRKTELVQEYARCVDERGIENVRHYIYWLGGEYGLTLLDRCYPYNAGEIFLLSIFETIGEEAMGDALGDLALGGPKNEEKVYRTFLMHVPENLMDEFQELYKKMHGGAFAFPETDFSDEHSDEPAAAYVIKTGVTVEGTLDYMFDFDYFRFPALKGDKYRVRVDHESLGFSSLSLFSPDGLTEEYWKSRARTASGPEIIWRASSSDEYYVAVQNFGGKSGPYALTVTHISDVADDHGDTRDDATSMSFDRAVKGIIEDEYDYDCFRLEVVEAGRYEIKVELDTLEYYHLIYSLPDGSTPGYQYYDNSPGTYGRTSENTLEVTETGAYHIALSGTRGSTGTYRITVTSN